MTKETNSTAEALARLLLADLTALSQLPMAPEQASIATAAQARAQALLDLLSPVAASAIDRDTFEDLIHIAGPETAPSLLHQVLSDLGEIQAKVADATSTSDWAQLRLQSHILISVAGSVGANDLLRRAEELNRLSHAKDQQALDALAPIVRDEVEALMQFVRNFALTMPVGPSAEDQKA